eukprot:NODE_939_length_2999_cov_0.589310.p2 type:complete len:179 gc:universal NODE_939_length_2999_cov_0.589310:816-1352(+)
MLFTTLSAISIITPKPVTYPKQTLAYCQKRFSNIQFFVAVDKEAWIKQCMNCEIECQVKPPVKNDAYEYCMAKTQLIKFANAAAQQNFIQNCMKTYQFCQKQQSSFPNADPKKIIAQCIDFNSICVAKTATMLFASGSSSQNYIDQCTKCELDFAQLRFIKAPTEAEKATMIKKCMLK